MSKLKISFLLLFILGITFILFQIQSIYFTRKNAEKEMLEKMRTDTKSAAKTLDKNLQKLVEVTKLLETISYKKLSKTEFENEFWTVFKENKDLFGIGACYEPFQFSDSLKLYSPFFFRPKNQEKLMNLDEGENGYDYTSSPSGGWYRSIRDGQLWQEPYFGRVAQAILAEYGIPIFSDKNKKNKPIGIVYTDYSLKNIKSMMKSLHFGETGYAYILSEEGTILSHPIEEYVKNSKKIIEVAKQQDDNGELMSFIDAINNKTASENDIFINQDEKTGQVIWRIFSNIPTTNWTLVTIFPEDELKIDVNNLRRKYINISIGVVFCIFVIALFYLNKNIHNKRLLWNSSLYFIGIVIIATISIYYFSMHYTPLQSFKSTKILNNSTKDKFLEMHAPLEKNKNKDLLIRVPSGINVKSYEFLDANNVFLTGYVWQQYKLNSFEDSTLNKGFVFPEATSTMFTKAYERISDDKRIIGWNFEAKIRLPLNYDKFPFDNKTLNLRLWHKDFDKNIILTPDLDSYAYTNPTSTPGLEKTIVFGNWNVLSSFFNYVKKQYNTKFGLEESNFTTNDDKEELNFTIVLERKFIGPLMANILPFLCIVLIHFASIMNMKHENRSYVLGASSGLIFAVLIAHFSMRGSINYAGIVYLESFYFVAYFIIALSIINNSLFHANKKINIIQYENNMIFRLTYWPIIVLVLFIVTAFTFY